MEGLTFIKYPLKTKLKKSNFKVKNKVSCFASKGKSQAGNDSTIRKGKIKGVRFPIKNKD